METERITNELMRLLKGKNEYIIHTKQQKKELSELLGIGSVISIIAINQKLSSLGINGSFVVIERYEHNSLDLKWIIMRTIPIIPTGKKLEQLLKNLD